MRLYVQKLLYELSRSHLISCRPGNNLEGQGRKMFIGLANWYFFFRMIFFRLDCLTTEIFP